MQYFIAFEYLPDVNFLFWSQDSVCHRKQPQAMKIKGKFKKV